MAIELTPQLRERIENTIRFLAVDAVQRANSGHPGAPMGLAGPAFELWDSQLRFDPSDPDWPMRDRFVLSNGHASMLLYSLLYLYGFGLSEEDIQNFRQLDSKTPGHPEYGETEGVEITTGPLGQGISHAVGMALGGRMARDQFGGAEGGGDGTGAPGGHFVYGIAGDGDFMEGISGEASSLAGHLKLGNLIFLYDDNSITIDGGTDLAFTEDVGRRYEAYGWQVLGPLDGQDHAALRAALEEAKSDVERPSLIITRTVIGLGSPAVAGKSKAHGSPLGAEEIARSKEKAGWPLEPEFLVPEDVAAYFAERSAAKRAEREALDVHSAAWREAQPERARAWDAARRRELPQGLGARLAEGMDVDAATRKHSGSVLEKLSGLVPYMAGGSADLAGSAAPPILKEVGVVGGPGAFYAGRNVHFGVREHAMAAVTNGLALDGTFLPYSGTFLIFSDYMRPAIRMAALMKLRSIFVFTHDSIFVGEDGPTHQPIEQLDSLRAIPGLTVFRPADGIETAMAYAWILERAEGPAMLSLTRQTLPALQRAAGFELEEVWKGAYTVREPEGDLDVVLLASGSEVALACDAAAKLDGEGIRARVVSVPCLELFESQPDAYQTALVPDDVPAVAVEAGRGESFRRLVGRRGLVCGIDRFGASAPAADLAEKFGFTPDGLSSKVRDFLA
ncbi:MAG: transketolase [Deltaproteobacteria bacterium]|nr:transketolase [Deltaproteobacteria bacterium]